MLLSQCPVNIARPVTAMKTPTTRTPKTQLGIDCFIKLVFMVSVFFTGHTSTQRIQLVHSSLQILSAACTFMSAGHASVQRLQSMHVDFSRVILKGLNQPAIPSNAPYGQRNRHQKFLTTVDKSMKTIIVHRAKVEICLLYTSDAAD